MHWEALEAPSPQLCALDVVDVIELGGHVMHPDVVYVVPPVVGSHLGGVWRGEIWKRSQDASEAKGQR